MNRIKGKTALVTGASHGLGMAIANGVNCPIVDAAKVRLYILAADLALGRDEYAMRYLKAYRKRKKG